MNFREVLKSMAPARSLEYLSDVRTAYRRHGFLRKLQTEHGAAQGSGKYVTYLVMQGMTNRLKGHVMAARYAEILGRTLAPFWIKTPECAAEFSDLFDLPDQDWRYKSQRVVRYDVKTDRADAEPEDLLHDPADLIVLDLDWQYIYMNRLLDRLGDKSFATIFQETLPVRDDIVQRVETTTQGWARPMIGVQIRRGDFVTYRQAVPPGSYIKATEAVMKKHPNSGILLASDASADELAEFIDYFGDRCVFNESMPRGNEDGIRDAMYDLLLLSKCRHLLLTKISGFGHMAAQIGDVPFEWVE